MTRPCECGLGLRPRRLFGFSMEPMDEAPCFFSGSLTLGGCGLPSTDRLAGGGWHPIGTMPTSSRQLKCQSVRRFSLLRQRLELA